MNKPKLVSIYHDLSSASLKHSNNFVLLEESFFLGQNCEISDEVPMLYQSQLHMEPIGNSLFQCYRKFCRILDVKLC